MYALVFTLLVTSLVSGAPNGGLGRITGGTLADVGQFPFVVSIAHNSEHICGGFIYSDRWVVTSAKCVHGKPQAELYAKFGALSLITPNPEEQIITILNIFEFSEFDPVSLKYDIALLELTRPITFGATAQFIRFDEIDELATPWDAYVVGWGATAEGGTYSSRLRWGPIDNLAADCGAYGIEEFSQDYMICAGSTSETISPCQYDEGTPLVQKTSYAGIQEEVVVGIMSKNKGCSDLSVPTIYTRLATYYIWILETAGPQPSSK